MLSAACYGNEGVRLFDPDENDGRAKISGPVVSFMLEDGAQVRLIVVGGVVVLHINDEPVIRGDPNLFDFEQYLPAPVVGGFMSCDIAPVQ